MFPATRMHDPAVCICPHSLLPLHLQATFLQGHQTHWLPLPHDPLTVTSAKTRRSHSGVLRGPERLQPSVMLSAETSALFSLVCSFSIIQRPSPRLWTGQQEEMLTSTHRGFLLQAEGKPLAISPQAERRVLQILFWALNSR